MDDGSICKYLLYLSVVAFLSLISEIQLSRKESQTRKPEKSGKYMICAVKDLEGVNMFRTDKKESLCTLEGYKIVMYVLEDFCEPVPCTQNMCIPIALLVSP